VKDRLAAGLRIFGKFGFEHHVAGHLSVRDPVDPSTYWVNPIGKAFRLMTISDLIQVNKHGEVVGGGKPGRRLANKAGFMIHSAIHEARSDANAICHAHTVYGKAFAALGKNLDIISQDSCVFYNDVALYDDFGGAALVKEEGVMIAKALGECKAGILRNHGLVTVGSTIESAVLWFIMLEQECQTQLLADAAAAGRNIQTVKIAPEEAAFTYSATGTERAGYFMASPYFEVIEAECGDEYKK